MTRMSLWRLAVAGLLALASGWAAGAGDTEGPAGATGPYADTYRGYDPGLGRAPATGAATAESMERSSEKSFYTLTLLPESDRANALVEAGIEKEHKGQFREAMEIYQKVIDGYPDLMWRVSEFGVFVPVAQYCQLRLLDFPRDELLAYRAKYDARAKESFGLARQRNSLEGLAEIRDTMLATSYGGATLLTLGSSALDRGHYLEALEYYERVWDGFPDTRIGNPFLAPAIALCRRMLGIGLATGESVGLAGHWKLDETGGARAADATGRGLHGALATGRGWQAGKIGGGLRFDSSNAVSVTQSSFLNIGVGGADFSVAFWLKWERGARPNYLFAKRGSKADEMLALSVVGKEQLGYTIATRSPTWESGASKTAVAPGQWCHVAFVKEGISVKIFLDGRLDTQDTLKEPALKNLGRVTFGQGFSGCMDDVRLYQRALLNREVAALAGTLGKVAIAATPARGEVPLAVELAAPAAATNATPDYLWEFGDGTTARGAGARHVYGSGGDFPVTLTVTTPDGRIAAGQTRIAAAWSTQQEQQGRRMDKLVESARYEQPAAVSQLSSPPNLTADDYTTMPPSRDPLALTEPEWSVDLPGARQDVTLWTQPVVTRQSVIYRHKNIVYCHSLLSGQLRWKNDAGGRVAWQSLAERQYPQEDILVQDGLVFTPMHKVGPTLVALDEVTGQMRWAYGPMTASTPEQARLRFETAPAGGPRAVFAGYVLDNILGETHTDTEYGVMAFESVTGRLLWRRELCRLRPGKFAAGFAVKRRNLIRSFMSPPLYREGTVYYGSNAGAMAALDALSGQVKWLMKYPYSIAPENVHDATRAYGEQAKTHYFAWPYHSPTFWNNQRPLLIGDALYMLPVDSPLLYRLDRRTGKVVWTKAKGEGILARRTDGGFTHFLGAMSSGELILAYSFRHIEQNWAGPEVNGGIHLVDPETGKTVWESGDLAMPTDQPLLKYPVSEGLGRDYGHVEKGWNYQLAARPFMDSEDRLCIGQAWYEGWPHHAAAYQMTVLSLRDRKIEAHRRYISTEHLLQFAWAQENGPDYLKRLEDIPHKDERTKETIRQLKEIIADTIPVNEYGPFMPPARITCDRFGVQFELRMTPRNLSMVFDRAAVKRALEGRSDPEALFGKAELAVSEGRLDAGARLLRDCLGAISPEDVDFRAMVNQQLYPVHKELARGGVRSGNRAAEQAHAEGMSQTVGTLTEEIESLLVLSEACERKGDWQRAARLTQSAIGRYGHIEYPVSSLLASGDKSQREACEELLDKMHGLTAASLYRREMGPAANLLKRGLGVYFGALSPLEKDLAVRVGELGATRLLALQAAFPELKAALDKEAEGQLGASSVAEQALRFWEYPGTRTAQQRVDDLLAATVKELRAKEADIEQAAALRKRAWALADAARVCGLQLPRALRDQLLAPEEPRDRIREPAGPLGNRTRNLEEARGPSWLVLERHGQHDVQPDWLFLGARVRMKLDNKFLLYCLDLKSGEPVWTAQEQRGEAWFDEIRLADKGDEPGFFQAFVHDDLVVVHGLYDVLGFNLKDGKLRWRYATPFGFEIRHAVVSGDLLTLAGDSETVMLFLGTRDPRGEVVWRERENGALYAPPYFQGDRLISVRRMPFNVTARYRSTGKLVGRLTLPDLSLVAEHPLLEKGAEALPLARDGARLAVTDGTYYLLLDVERMRVVWKRLIDANDPTRWPALRFELNGDFLAVVKQDFDVKTIYMLSSRTGEILWNTDPKVAGSPQPLQSMAIRDGKLYGIRSHAGQGFYFVGLDCRTGKDLFKPNEQKAYGGKPDVMLRPEGGRETLVAQVRDRQDFELKSFSLRDGSLLHTVKVKAAGDFGEHGRASAVVQNGCLALLGKNELVTAVPKQQ